MNLAPLLLLLVLRNEPRAHTSDGADWEMQTGLGEADPNYRMFFSMVKDCTVCKVLNSIALLNPNMSSRSPRTGKKCPSVSHDARVRDGLHGAHHKLGDGFMTTGWEPMYSNPP